MELGTKVYDPVFGINCLKKQTQRQSHFLKKLKSLHCYFNKNTRNLTYPFSHFYLVRSLDYTVHRPAPVLLSKYHLIH